jgi:hypothetical protein
LYARRFLVTSAEAHRGDGGVPAYLPCLQHVTKAARIARTAIINTIVDTLR